MEAVILMVAVGVQNQAPIEETHLSPKEEEVIRRLVYGGSFKTAHAKKGKWAGYNILLVPEQLSVIFNKKSSETLRLLKKITEGANPPQALLAAGYAISLAKSPVAGHVIIFRRHELVDEVEKSTGVSYRTRLVRDISSVIRDWGKKK